MMIQKENFVLVYYVAFANEKETHTCILQRHLSAYQQHLLQFHFTFSAQVPLPTTDMYRQAEIKQNKNAILPFKRQSTTMLGSYKNEMRRILRACKSPASFSL